MTPQNFTPERHIELSGEATTIQMPYHLFADIVLVVHLGVIIFVVGGLFLIFVGNRFARWSWVNSLWFRLAHLATIVVIVFQAWFGQVCSLTILESWLRQREEVSGYEHGFIEYWVQWLIFYQAPSWVFTTIYTVFGLIVAIVWWIYPPRYDHGPKGDG